MDVMNDAVLMPFTMSNLLGTTGTKKLFVVRWKDDTDVGFEDDDDALHSNDNHDDKNYCVCHVVPFGPAYRAGMEPTNKLIAWTINPPETTKPTLYRWTSTSLKAVNKFPPTTIITILVQDQNGKIVLPKLIDAVRRRGINHLYENTWKAFRYLWLKKRQDPNLDIPLPTDMPDAKVKGKATLYLGRRRIETSIGFTTRPEDGTWCVESVTENSPASRAGLAPGDKLRAWLTIKDPYHRYWCAESLEEITIYFDEQQPNTYIELLVVKTTASTKWIKKSSARASAIKMRVEGNDRAFHEQYYQYECQRKVMPHDDNDIGHKRGRNTNDTSDGAEASSKRPRMSTEAVVGGRTEMNEDESMNNDVVDSEANEEIKREEAVTVDLTETDEDESTDHDVVDLEANETESNVEMTQANVNSRERVSQILTKIIETYKKMKVVDKTQLGALFVALKVEPPQSVLVALERIVPSVVGALVHARDEDTVQSDLLEQIVNVVIESPREDEYDVDSRWEPSIAKMKEDAKQVENTFEDAERGEPVRMSAIAIGLSLCIKWSESIRSSCAQAQQTSAIERLDGLKKNIQASLNQAEKETTSGESESESDFLDSCKQFYKRLHRLQAEVSKCVEDCSTKCARRVEELKRLAQDILNTSLTVYTSKMVKELQDFATYHAEHQANTLRDIKEQEEMQREHCRRYPNSKLRPQGENFDIKIASMNNTIALSNDYITEVIYQQRQVWEGKQDVFCQAEFEFVKTEYVKLWNSLGDDAKQLMRGCFEVLRTLDSSIQSPAVPMMMETSDTVNPVDSNEPDVNASRAVDKNLSSPSGASNESMRDTSSGSTKQPSNAMEDEMKEDSGVLEAAKNEGDASQCESEDSEDTEKSGCEVM